MAVNLAVSLDFLPFLAGLISSLEIMGTCDPRAGIAQKYNKLHSWKKFFLRSILYAQLKII
jgi:hypothetical protein